MRLQRRQASQTWYSHGRHRQTPDRLWLSSLHGELPADRSRRLDDRADRDRKQRRVGLFYRRHDFHSKRSRGDSAAGPRCPPLHPHQPRGRSGRCPQTDRPLEKVRRDLLLVLLAVLALRLPFLNQAIQGDDLFYLYGAEHAQIDPLHPTHAAYAFQGRLVSMQGHPHPPLNAWFLGALLAIFRDVREIPFHAAYILFSCIAALSALSLAHRFSPHPLLATLLFLATPVFIVNGNSLEADVPFLAFWLLSIATFIVAVDRRSLPMLAASCLAMALAALMAYQAIVLAPILLLYGRKWRPAFVAAFTAPVVIGVWLLYERLSAGTLPVTVLAGYMQSYGFQQITQKVRNAVALTGHLGWLVCPILWVGQDGILRRLGRSPCGGLNNPP